MTLQWRNSLVKPNTNPCHHVYLGWDLLGVMQVLATSPIYINEPVIWSISFILVKGYIGVI